MAVRGKDGFGEKKRKKEKNEREKSREKSREKMLANSNLNCLV
jgi:hypothetical protein